MNSVTAVSGTSMKSAKIASAYNAKVLALQKNAVRMQGQMAVKTINSAISASPAARGMNTGRILNVTA